MLTRSLFLIIFLLSFFSGPLLPSEKRLRVVADTADIYLKPDERSSVIGTVEKGTILILRIDGKIKKIWYYVYFTSKEKGITKSGYIQDSLVEKLFEVTKVITLRDEEMELKRHFRQTRWGMSKERVLELEGEPSHQRIVDGLEMIGYRQKVMDFDCLIEYVFEENKLIRGKYIFLEEHKYKNQYIGDYKKIKDMLIEKYEQPEKDNVTWRNTLFKEDYSRWGLAVSLGHLEYSSLWKTPETEILLRLSGDDMKVSLAIEYTGLEYKDREKEAEGIELLNLR